MSQPAASSKVVSVRKPWAWDSIALELWLSISILVFAAGAIHEFNRPIDEGGGTVFALAARSYVHDGIIPLRGLMIVNNPPQGLETDWYLHWPPLFAILLAFAYRIFGESPSTAHALMLAGVAVTALALFAAVNSSWGRRAGLWAVFAFLVLPPTYLFGHYLVSQTLVMPLLVLTVWCFFRSSQGAGSIWAWLGAIFLVLAILISWEGLLLPAGFLISAVVARDRRRLKLALLYLATAVASFFALLGFYIYNAQSLGAELFHTLMYRMGFSYGDLPTQRIHSLAKYPAEIVPGPLLFLRQHAIYLYVLGPIALVAAAGMAIWIVLQRARPQYRQLATLLFTLLSPWLLWIILMRNHGYIHEQQVLLATPACAAAMGVAAGNLLGWGQSLEAQSRKLVNILLLAVVPTVLMMGMSRTILKLPVLSDSDYYYRPFGMAVGDDTPAGAVVLTANESPDVTYYSRRHVVRGVYDDALLDQFRSRIIDAFPGAPVFLALLPRELAAFPRALQTYPIVKQTPELTLLRINP
ncbi:MAG TPA: glycosyltransferase family 39 protein [Terriglobales bacterium]